MVLLIVALNAKHALTGQGAEGQAKAASQTSAAKQQVDAFQQELNKAMAAAAARQASATE
jgi:hypothetical protein